MTTTVEEISLTSSLGLMIAKSRSGTTRLENLMILYCCVIHFLHRKFSTQITEIIGIKAEQGIFL